jgi:hypothetical protein
MSTGEIEIQGIFPLSETIYYKKRNYFLPMLTFPVKGGTINNEKNDRNRVYIPCQRKGSFR